MQFAGELVVNLSVVFVGEPLYERLGFLRSDTRYHRQGLLCLRCEKCGRLRLAFSEADEFVELISRQQSVAHIVSAERNAEGIEQSTGFHGAGFLYRRHDIVGGLIPESVEAGYLRRMLRKVEDVGKILDPSEVDEPLQGLLGDAVDVDALLGDEPCELLQLLRRACGVGAVERLRATGRTALNLSLRTAYRAAVRDL